MADGEVGVTAEPLVVDGYCKHHERILTHAEWKVGECWWCFPDHAPSDCKMIHDLGPEGKRALAEYGDVLNAFVKQQKIMRDDNRAAKAA